MTTVTVSLEKRTQSGTDAFNEPEYTVETVSVSGVLVGEPSTEDITNAYAMHGARVTYRLAIPKGDENDWDNTYVTLPSPFSGRYRTVGIATSGIEANIPLRWNKKVLLERYEG